MTNEYTKEIQCSIDNINIELYRLREMVDNNNDFPQQVEIAVEKMDDILQDLDNIVNFHQYHNVNYTEIDE